MDGPVGVQACGWACSHVGIRMRMAVNKKKKGKKEKEKTYWLVPSMRMGVRTCGRADGRAEADDCKKRKKRKKEKERKRKDSLVFRAGGWACGRVADGRVWMRLWADVNGCK